MIATSEIHDFALIVLVVAGGLWLAVLGARASDRFPVPAPVILLVAAALASDVFPTLRNALGIEDVERVAVAALVVILFNGGLDLGWRKLRASAGPVLSLGILGTFVTAGVIALGAHVVLGFDWSLSGVLGAALAPTDPAVMFSVLGGHALNGRSGSILEGEAGFNDPAGIALMLGMIELATHADASFMLVVTDFAKEMAIGAVVGIFGARLIRAAHPAGALVALLLAGVLYGATGLLGGSGFLAVFVAGLLIGDDEEVAERTAYTSVAGASEVVVFVVLGITIGITDLPATTWRDGAVLAVVIALAARPLAVATTLAGARLNINERLFIAWSGLKGAVPILLAAFAVLGGVDDAGRLYGIVFVVVTISVAVQGTLVPAVAARLGVTSPAAR